MAPHSNIQRSGAMAGRAVRPIRLMIVDDSLVARTVIARMLEDQVDFTVVATAGHAAEALETLNHVQVDIILLDVEMPGMDGLTALPEILSQSRGAHVLIVSSSASEGAVATVQALTLGAADTLLKPGVGRFAGSFAVTLGERLRRIGHAREVREARQTPAPKLIERPVDAAVELAPITCLAIGASTGGLHALSDFFRALPQDLNVPILVTQHLPPVFMPYFAAQLADISGRRARVAQDGMRPIAGELLIAPGDGHLTLERRGSAQVVRIDRSAAASGCMPSVDPMFASIAPLHGKGAVGVVLTGMGRDGLIGAGRIVAEGGEVLAQDMQSSVVWGMPGVVANAGLASAVLPPARLAHHVAKRRELALWK